MRPVRFVVLMVGAVAGSASLAGAQATSGWILWEKNYRTKGSSTTTEWEPIDGYATLAECRRAGQQNFQFALDYMKSGAGKLLGPVRPDGRSAVFELADAAGPSTVDIRYLCFPGPFDPRPSRSG